MSNSHTFYILSHYITFSQRTSVLPSFRNSSIIPALPSLPPTYHHRLLQYYCRHLVKNIPSPHNPTSRKHSAILSFRQTANPTGRYCMSHVSLSETSRSNCFCVDHFISSSLMESCPLRVPAGSRSAACSFPVPCGDDPSHWSAGGCSGDHGS